MLGGAREFRYDWILLRARNLPHEADGTPAPIILRGGKQFPLQLTVVRVLWAPVAIRRRAGLRLIPESRGPGVG